MKNKIRVKDKKPTRKMEERNMKNRILVACLLSAMCLGLTGCKSSDYKEALAFQESGDYSAALMIYDELGDYKDSTNRGSECQAFITAIDNFNTAKDTVNSKNTELDTEISKAEALITSVEIALDETLRPTMETAVFETKAKKVTLPEMPVSVDDINAETDKLNVVDYTDAIIKLNEAYSALDTSIKQYVLVNNPTEGYVIKCLGTVSHIVDISAVTEDNDPNGNLNKSGGYTAHVYFSSDLINQEEIQGVTIIDKGTDCGGSIEVYSTPEDAQQREEYLAAFDGGIFASGSHTVVGTVLVRTSDKLKASEQKEMEANIITVLTTIKN